MSRSFGDRVAASVGVIAEPEIMEYKFQEDDKFIIVASDGVWEFIESQEVINFFIYSALISSKNII
jgi:serine/threonine protein phosphatase PrpC